MSGNEELKQQIKSQRPGKPERITGTASRRKIDYQVDTIPVPGDFAAYMSPDRNAITQNYVVGQNNSFNQRASLLAHEQKHRDNNIAGMNNMPMSLEQYYKVCCHNEISATMCELLQLRQEYIDAPSAEAREEIIKDNPKFSYYFDAVKKGEINPLAQNAAEFEKEMKFIATETQEYWMNTWAASYDHKSHTSMIKSFFNTHNYDELASNDANYAKALNIAYNIGGIDFSKYMEEDIECINNSVKQADKKIAKKQHRNNIGIKENPREPDTFTPVTSYNRFDKLIVENPQLTPTQKFRLLQHSGYAKNIEMNYFSFIKKYERDLSKCVPAAIHFFQQDLEEQPELKQLLEEGFINTLQIVNQEQSAQFLPEENELNKAEYAKILTQIYTMNGIDISKYYDVESIIGNTTPEMITELEKSKPKLPSSYFAKKAEQKATKEVVALQQDSTYMNAQQQPSHYTGDPIYFDWSPNTRVSPVQYGEIYDFTQPFLAEQQQAFQEREMIAQNKINETKMTQAVRKNERKKPDETYARKAPEQKKDEVKGKEAETWTAVKNWWNETFGR